MRKRTLASWIALFAKLSSIALVAVTACFVLFTLANFSDNVKRFSFYIKTTDAEMAKKELVGLHYFYDLSRKWKVQWLADKYLFRDAPFYGPADSYLIRDWDKVMNDLKERLDDPKAYPYGNAKFRYVQFKIYKAGKTKEGLGLVLTEVAADYEKALRNCLDSGVTYLECYDRVWNYDLATNKKNAEEALKEPMPVVKYILGPPRDERGNVPILPQEKIPGGGMEPEKTPDGGKDRGEKPGGGGPKKRP